MKAAIARNTFLLLALVLLLVVGFGFRGLLGAYVVEPAAAMLWAAWRVIISVDQGVYWFLVILLCALLTIRAFSTGGGGQRAPALVQRARQRPAVDQWRALLEDAQHSRQAAAALRGRLISLLESALARAGQPPARDLTEALSAGHVSLPPELLQYLSPTREHTPGSLVARLAARFRSGLANRALRNEAAIDGILRWLEDAMEIKHDQ